MKFVKNDHADASVQMIGIVIGILITIIIAALVLYTVVGSLDYTTVDGKVAEARGYVNGPTVGDDANSSWTNYNASTDLTNASDDVLDQSAIFFQIAPLIAIVLIAVVILGYVGKIGGD